MSTSNELRTFNYTGLELHILVQDGEPWFAGMDVVSALALGTAAKAYSRLGDEEKSNVCRTHLGLKPGRPLKFASESGLYKLIMRSDKPEARKFQDWVTRDVLPPIVPRPKNNLPRIIFQEYSIFWK